MSEAVNSEGASEVTVDHKEKPVKHRPVRSFVLREGRITPGQRRALDDLWPQYGIELGDELLNFEQQFGRRAPITLEIGFGMGQSLLEMAGQDPEQDYLGIEVHRPGVGSFLNGIEDQGLTNIRVMNDDAVVILEKMIPDASLDRICLFFPDPWPKKKHHKRRFIQSERVGLIARKLKAGGIFHMATDWEQYAEHMLEVMNAAALFDNCATDKGYSERPAYRGLTKFERRGQRLGHGVWDLLYRRTS